MEWVRHQLEGLVGERLFRGLSPVEERRFQNLCGQEVFLLELRPSV